MRIRARLKRVEQALDAVPRPPTGPRSDGEWYAAFTQLGAEGAFAGEPEFEVALAGYRQALDTAGDGSDEAHRAWSWLGEMLDRVTLGIPTVSADEWADLARWLEANAGRLPPDLMRLRPDSMPWVMVGPDYLRHIFR